MVSPQYLRYAAGSEKEKRAGGRLHGGIIAQLFVFCKGGVAGALPGRMVLSWRAPSISGGSGLACAVVPPAHPPTFLETGGHAVPRGGGAAPPAPRLGNGRALPHLPLSTGGGTRCACWTGGLVVACALLQRGVGLACAVVPPAHPPTFLETGGLAVPPAGAAPPAPRLGNGGALPHLPLSTGGRTRCACWTGGLVVACALLQRGVGLACAVVPPAPPSNVFRNRGDTPCTPCGGCAPCTLLGVRRWRAWVGAS